VLCSVGNLDYCCRGRVVTVCAEYRGCKVKIPNDRHSPAHQHRRCRALGPGATVNQHFPITKLLSGPDNIEVEARGRLIGIRTRANQVFA
jgi:hypothetical protein